METKKKLRSDIDGLKNDMVLLIKHSEKLDNCVKYIATILNKIDTSIALTKDEKDLLDSMLDIIEM
jgi:hypothetical protein